jgi:hypothetical protein
MKKLALLLATFVALAVTAHAAVTSVTWNSVNGGTNLTRTYTVNAGSAITNITGTITGTNFIASPGGCGITPALPAGLSWSQTSTSVCQISGTPTTTSPTKTYFINFRTSSGSPTDSLSFITLTVGPTTNLVYPQRSARLTKDVEMTTITPTIMGTPTAYSISGPGVTDAASFNTLTGLTFNTSTGAISGTPNANLALSKFIINATDGTYNLSGGTAGLVDSVSIQITDAADYSTWSYYKNITVTPTGLGGAVTNYPLLIKLTSSNFDFSQSTSDITSLAGSSITGTGGADIRFTLANGITDLPYQVERWDGTGQVAEIWVNVPIVANSGSTVIKMHWGKSGQTTTSSGPNTFPTVENIQGVWHMNANGSGNEADATSNGFLATTGGTAPTNASSPLIGPARTFGGAGYLKLSAPSTASSILSFPQNSQWTISSWVKPTNITGGRQIVGKSNQQYSLQISGNNPNGLTGNYYEGVEYTVVRNATDAATLSSFWPHTFSLATSSVWANVVLVQKFGARYLYVNGTLTGFNSSQPSGYLFDRNGTTARQTDRDVVFGGQPGSAPSGGTFTKFFIGDIDEISMHTSARDSNWIKLNFQTQCSAGLPASCPSSPVAYGAAIQNVPPTSLTYGTNPATYKQGIAITPNTPTTGGGAPTSYSITPDLNALTGLTFNTTTGVISGAATLITSATDYLVTATNFYGNDTETVNITTTLPSAPSLTYPGSPYTRTATQSAGTITPNNAGDVATSCSVLPALPTGLSLSNTCVITGTPMVSSASTDYTVSASNAGGSNDAHVFIAVASTTPTVITPPERRNAVIGATDVKFGVSVVSGGTETVTYKWVRTMQFNFGGAIDTLQITSNTSALTDTLFLSPDSVAPFADSSRYHVVVQNSVGSVNSSNVLLLITPTVSYPQSTYVLAKGETIITPTTQANITSCASLPTLPAGLSISATTCAITGTPTTAQLPTNYSITPVGPGGTGTAFVLNLAVVNAPRIMHYTSDSTARFEQNVAIPTMLPLVLDSLLTPLTYAVTSGVLPDGLSLNANTGAITGTPTSAGSSSPVITATNASGSTARTLNITVYAEETYTGSFAEFNFNTARAGVASSQANFPVLIRLTNAHREIFQNTDSAGIRFTNGSGTHLPYQIDNWRTLPTDTSAAIWVKLDNAAANTSNTVRMYWGQSLGGGRSEGQLVFPRSSGHQAVWHMNAGSTGNELDASSNNFTATAANAPLDTTGAMGRSRNFNGTNQYFAVAGSVTGPLNFKMTDNYSFSSWVFVNSVPATSNSGIQIINKGDNQYTMAAYDGATSPKYWEITTRGNNGYQQARSNGSPAITANSHIGSWHYISGTYQGAPVGAAIAETLYIDGARVNVLATTNQNNTGRNETFGVHIGGLAGGTAPGSTFTRYFVGNIDELRVASVTRSPDWIKLEYKNQKPGTTPVANLAYAAPAAVYFRDAAISQIGMTGILGNVTKYEATNLPAGLSIHPTTGEISGTPSVEGVFNVTVTGYGDSAWSTTANLSLNVISPVPVFTYASPHTYNFGAAITALNPSHTGGTVTTWTINPALPTGLSFNTGNGAITGTPAAVSAATDYTIIGTNADGADTAVVNIATPAVVPSTPTGFAILPGNGKIFADWTASAFNGGAAITGYTVTATPGGATCVWSSGPMTCTVTGLSNGTEYTLSVVATNSVGNSDASSTAAATPGPAPQISYVGAPYTFSMGSPVNQPATNSGTGGSNWTIAPNLNALTGLLFNPLTGRITGNPAYATTATNYRVTMTNPSGKVDRITISIATPAVAPNVSYTTPHTYPIGTPIPDLLASNSGGGVASWFITPNLNPLTGLLFSPVTGKITGTPVYGSSATDYTVIATGFGGTIDSTIVNIATVSVPPDISYTGSPFDFAVGSPISDLLPSNTGAPAVGWSIQPPLTPATGLLFNPTTGRIFGTPVYGSLAANYTVVATARGGATDTTVINIATTTAAPTVSYPDTTVNYPVGTPIAALAKTGTTGFVSGFTISPALPTGLFFNPTNGTIAGNPAAISSATMYTITVHGPGGTGTDSVSIQTSTAAPTVSYPDTTVNYAVGTPITPLAKTGATGLITGYSISPALPTGLFFSTTTGTIVGNPAVITGATMYTITATGPGGTGTDSLSIQTSTAAPTVTYDDGAQNYPVGTPITPLAKTGASGIILGYSINPALPAGLFFSPTTGAIAGNPAVVSAPTMYTITVTGPGGTGTDSVSIQTSTAAPTVTYDDAPLVYTLYSTITPLVKTGATGIITGYSVTPALPAGLLFSPATGNISGNPSALTSAAMYTITATGPGGTGTDSVSIAVTAAAPTLTYSHTPLSYPVGSAIATVTKTGASGIITGYSVTPALPGNLVLNTSTGAISGTPTVVTAAAWYKVTATGPGGTATDSVNIETVTPAPTVTYDHTPLSYPLGVVISQVSRTGATGIISGYSVTPALPTGLTLNTTNGRINGNPSVAVAATWYKITVTGPGGTGVDSVNITTTLNPPVLSFAAGPYSFVKNAAITAFRADNAGGPITGWSIGLGSNGASLTANTGLVFSPSTGRIQGTPVYVSPARTYVVTANSLGGASDTETVSIAVTLVAKGAIGENTFSFRVTGGAVGYNLRMPKIDESTENVTVTISDLSGRQIWSKGVDPRSGIRELAWDGRDNSGRLVAGGMYMVRVSATGEGKTSTVTNKAVSLDK